MREQQYQTPLLMLILLGLFGLTLSGCAGAVFGVGTAAVAASTTEKGFSTSVSDGMIFAKLNEKFLHSNQTLLTNADVEVNDGEVILTGRVKTNDEKALATKLAWEIKGVKSVINHLTVSEKPSVKQAPSNNAVIGRYILPRTIFKKIKSLKPAKGKEIHITDAIQLLIDDKEKFVAHNFEGKYLDCGTMSGYINSSKEIGKI